MKITDYVHEKYRKYIRYGYDIFLILLFVGMAYYCASTNCYEVTDQYGNPLPKEEINRILRQYIKSANQPPIQLNITNPATIGTILPPNQCGNNTDD